MKQFLIAVVVTLFLISCEESEQQKVFTTVEVQTLFMDSISIRAIEIMDGSLAFASDKGVYGSVDTETNDVLLNTEKFHTSIPHFRAVAHTDTDFFMLSIGNPALLYKTGENGKMDLVYKEEADNVFYDAMTFWNNDEGIAVGDSMNGCLSIIITRDGGNTWSKSVCDDLPMATDKEGAFAASNTNIVVKGDKTWIVTTSSRVYYSENKGITWEIYETPILSKEPTEGIYSLDFYDDKIGFVIGGDYLNPEENAQNKAITLDGGKTWNLVANRANPGYKSCVQFVPNAKGKALVSVGFTGISYSCDKGAHWKKLSESSFYTIRFLNDSIAYAAGKNKIAKLVFR